MLGKYGETVREFNKELQKKVIGDETPITCRFADTLKPELETLNKEIEAYKEKDEDVLSYALFPQVAVEYFKYRQTQKNGIDGKLFDRQNEAYPV